MSDELGIIVDVHMALLGAAGQLLVQGGAVALFLRVVHLPYQDGVSQQHLGLALTAEPAIGNNEMKT